MEPLEESVEVAPPQPVWRRWLKRAGWSLLVLLIVLAGRQLWTQHRASNRLQETLAEMDRAEPGWRLEEIEAARDTPPEDENSARCVVTAGAMLPKNWPPQEFTKLFDHLAANERLSAESAARLEQQLADLGPAVEEARRLADLPHGRHRIRWQRNVMVTLLPDQQETRRVTDLLLCDALRHGQAGDLKAALTSCRAALNAGRSLGDEPLYVSQLIRIACVVRSCQAIERALGQGQPEAEDLAALQKLLQTEDAHPALVIATRGERGGFHAMFNLLESGEVSVAEVAGGRPNWQDVPLGWFVRANASDDHALMLALMTRRIAETQLPLHEQAAAERRFEQDIRELPKTAILTRLFMPAIANLGAAERRRHAYVRCTMAALAVERYRLRHRGWPESLAKLTPDLLSTVPLDPSTGEPLHYRRLVDGVVIYSVGADGVDNEGNLDRERVDAPGVDVGIRLWDVAKRRQPPAPKRPEDDPPR